MFLSSFAWVIVAQVVLFCQPLVTVGQSGVPLGNGFDEPWIYRWDLADITHQLRDTVCSSE